MVRSSTKTFYGQKNGERNQTHKTRRQVVKEFVAEWVGKAEKDVIKEDANRQSFISDLLRRVCGIDQPTQYIEYEKKVLVKSEVNGKVMNCQIDGYIPSTKVIWEMKGSDDKDLDKPIRQSDGAMLTPYEQAKRYANFLPQNEQPRWIVVSNFVEIRVYDMNEPLPKPKTIYANKLAIDYKALDFMVDVNEQQIIDEKQLSVDAGSLVAKIYNELVTAYSLHADINDPKIQKSLNMLIVRLVFLLYADDTGVLGRENMFQEFMERREPQDIRSALIDLFKVLDEDPEKGERSGFLSPEYLQFKYVNGGMFKDENIVIPQFTQSLKDLIVNEASKGFNWANISPTIFGAVFESTLNPATRRSGGMHYTSIENIHKVIDPLFLDDLRLEFNKIQDMANVNQRVTAALMFQDKIANLKFFDPACGSGNFLTETYLSLRRLENECLKIIVGNRAIISLGNQNPTKVKVRIQNFYGIEINDFAVSVARTAMWIAESQMWDQSQNIIYSREDFLPLDSNDSIYEGNALRMNWEDIVKPYELSYIMGNPPFVGYYDESNEQKADIKQFFKSTGRLDYVVGWYIKAAKYIKGTTIDVAFVSTNSITQGVQVPLLWNELNKYDIDILFGHRTFAWDNEAKEKASVFCVIIAFTSRKTTASKLIFDDTKIIKASYISPYLIPDLKPIIQTSSKPICDGVSPIVLGSMAKDGGGFFLTPAEREKVLKEEPNIEKYIKQFLDARSLLHGKKRYCLWLINATPSDINHSKFISERLNNVINFRKASKAPSTKELAKYPTRFAQIAQPNNDYLVIPRHSSQNREYIPFPVESKDKIAGDALNIIPDIKMEQFAILESKVHMAWVKVVAGRIKGDYRYNKTIVYNPFPWPKINDETKIKLQASGQNILDARNENQDSTLDDLYNNKSMPANLRKAHDNNDKVVLSAYGLSKNANDKEIQDKLFAMYSQIMEKKSK